mmetsp:Transcript_9324/g.19006  ORF Transcript_9324/g.19006 Transcript_9324/m.19006 type:complete len:215 (+) Transcript_9324:588-1232(+)
MTAHRSPWTRDQKNDPWASPNAPPSTSLTTAFIIASWCLLRNRTATTLSASKMMLMASKFRMIELDDTGLVISKIMVELVAINGIMNLRIRSATRTTSAGLFRVSFTWWSRTISSMDASSMSTVLKTNSCNITKNSIPAATSQARALWVVRAEGWTAAATAYIPKVPVCRSVRGETEPTPSRRPTMERYRCCCGGAGGGAITSRGGAAAASTGA